MNQFDGYWAAKIIARLKRGHIEGAVGAGQLSSPQSRQYMVQTLVERQRKTMQTWFEKVAPLDEFELTGAAAAYDLCFDDLLLKHGLQTAASVATEYEGEALDASGAALGWHVRGAPKAGGRACVRGLRASTSPEGYTMVKLTIVRGKTRMPPIMLHLAIDPATNALRLIGIERG